MYLINCEQFYVGFFLISQHVNNVLFVGLPDIICNLTKQGKSVEQ